MASRWIHTIFGMLMGFITPLFLGGIIAEIRGVHFYTFFWNLTHRIPFYNSFFQLGIAINIGIFFLIMKNDKAIFLGRGWLVATILSMLWTVIIELNAL